MSKRPRISVVLDEDVLTTFKRVAAVQGRSVSAVASEMLAGVEPGLRQVADLGEAFERLSEVQRERVRVAVAEADARLGTPMTSAVEGALEVFRELSNIANTAGGQEMPTPLGNTGVR